jgi:hypothetical protein
MGEGTKKDLHRVTLANTNPAILRIFLVFLEKFCSVSRSQINAWINIFDDYNVEEATRWWANELGLSLEQFYATTVRQSRGGNYTKKSKFGTLTVYFANSKLKKIVDDWCADYYKKFFSLD